MKYKETQIEEIQYMLNDILNEKKINETKRYNSEEHFLK